MNEVELHSLIDYNLIIVQKPTFVENKMYHIYNRGVEKRKIFLDKQDHLRFIHNLFEFNDENSVINFSRKFNNNSSMNEVGLHSLNKKVREPRKLLVEILIFTLMPNHFHLLLKQKKEHGVSRFMQKVGTGYVKYFNQKYERVGGLFQGRFKAVSIDEEAHFIHIPYYIHSNPLELTNNKSIEFLENYRWSSFADYVGRKNFPSVTQREFLLEFFGSKKKYKKETKEWIKEKQKNLEKLQGITLE